MWCGRCCATEPRLRTALRLDIFIEILLRGWVNRAFEDAGGFVGWHPVSTCDDLPGKERIDGVG